MPNWDTILINRLCWYKERSFWRKISMSYLCEGAANIFENLWSLPRLKWSIDNFRFQRVFHDAITLKASDTITEIISSRALLAIVRVLLRLQLTFFSPVDEILILSIVVEAIDSKPLSSLFGVCLYPISSTKKRGLSFHSGPFF